MFEQELKILRADLKELRDRIKKASKITNRKLQRITVLKLYDLEETLNEIRKILNGVLRITRFFDFKDDSSKIEKLSEALTHLTEQFIYIDIGPERLAEFSEQSKPEMIDWLEGSEMNLIHKLDELAAALEDILKNHMNAEGRERRRVAIIIARIERVRAELKRIRRELHDESRLVAAA